MFVSISFSKTFITYFLTISLWRYTLQTPLTPPKDTHLKTGRLAVQVVRTAADFLRSSNNQETNKSADSSSTMAVEEEQSREPVWYLKNQLSSLKKARRGKRKKRRAHINHASVYISEFPTNTRFYKLCNKLGYYLRFHEDGKIDGTRNQEDKKTLLVFESHGPSIIRVKSLLSKRYLTMSEMGVPSAETHPAFFNSLFRLTHEENAWDTIASFKFYFDEKFDMLIGITKEATVKKPWKASPGQHATQFLPVPYTHTE